MNKQNKAGVENKGEIMLGARTGANNAMKTDKKNVYMKIFQMIDKDGGGSLDHVELKQALADLGEHLTTEDVKDMIAEIDQDGNGTIEMDEFLMLIQQRIKDKNFFEACIKSFHLFAETNEAYITQKEFMKIVAAAKKESNRFEIQAIMRELPWDKDGNLPINEFLSEFFGDL